MKIGNRKMNQTVMIVGEVSVRLSQKMIITTRKSKEKLI